MRHAELEAEEWSKVWDHLGICGCSDESLVEWLIEALRLIAVRREEDFDGTSNDRLGRHFGDMDDGRYWALWAWLDGAGLIEHGGNVVGSWLTDKGRGFLAFLDSAAGQIVREHNGFAWDADTGALINPDIP